MRGEGSGRAALLTTALLLVAIATGCGGQGGDATGPPDTELAGDWVLVDGHGPDGDIAHPTGHDATLTIDGTEWGGTSFCNRYGGEVVRDGRQLQLDGVSATEMGCPDEGVMEAEQAYLAAFSEVDELQLDGDTLVLRGAGTELTFERAGSTGV